MIPAAFSRCVGVVGWSKIETDVVERISTAENDNNGGRRSTMIGSYPFEGKLKTGLRECSVDDFCSSNGKKKIFVTYLITISHLALFSKNEH